MALPRILRPVLRTVGIATVASSVLACTGPLAWAAVRPAPRVAGTSTLWLTNAVAKVKTSNGDSFFLVVNWQSGLGAPGTADLGVALERLVTSPSGVEIHDWGFDVKSSTLAFNGKTGTLDSGTEANPVAALDLSFKTTSSTKGSCIAGSEIVYHGTLSGKASLVTGLTGGGTVGGTVSFSAITPELIVDSGCVPPRDPCAPESLAGSAALGGGGISVFAGSYHLGTLTESFVGLEEMTRLKAPANATRTDIAAMEDKTGVVYAKLVSGGVKIASTGLVTGSGIVNGGKPFAKRTICSYKGKKYFIKLQVDNPANYSGKFSAKMDIGSSLTAPTSSKTGFYEFLTTKLA
jgi:hypothetical protein